MRNLSCFFLLIGVFFNTYLMAQPELDTSFASTGKTMVPFPGIGNVQDALVQPDNKIVLVAPCSTINFGSFPFCVIRLNENGSLDTAFNNTGYALTDIPGTNPNLNKSSRGVALQNDGKLVTVGNAAFSNQERIVMVRYNPNGTLDLTFGVDGNGIVTTAFNSNARAYKVAIQPDGKIVIVGFTESSSIPQQIVARYSANGTLDNTFGTGGIATISVPGNYTTGLSIALQEDGKILTGGLISTLSGAPMPSASYLLTRLNAEDGSLDATWDGDGLRTVQFGTAPAFFEFGILSLAIQGDGRAVALGHLNNLYRFNPDGSFDTSFDNDGSRTALNGTSDSYDVTVTPSGKITAVGFRNLQSSSGMPVEFRVARYLPNGAPDPVFSDDGFLDIDVVASMLDGATAVAPDSQGRIVVAGRSAMGTVTLPWENPRFSVARLIAPPVQNVGFSGRVTNSDGRAITNAYVTLQRGAETIGIARTNPFGHFRFKNVASPQTYTLSVTAKGFIFNQRNVLIDDEVTNFSIVGRRP